MKKLLFPFLLVGLLAGCSSDDATDPIKPIDPVSPDPIDIPLIISSVSTNDKSTFDETTSIGLLLDNSKKVSDLVEYINPNSDGAIDTKTITKASLNSWRPRNSKDKFFLNSEFAEYKLFAFTPYDKDFKIDTPKKIESKRYTRMTNFCENEYNFCYGFVDKLTFKNPEANLKLQHLYSRIDLNIRGNYQQDKGVLSHIYIYGDGGILSSAKVDFKDYANVKFLDKKYSTATDKLELLPAEDYNITNSYTNVSCLMIPTSATEFKGPTILEFTIDNKSVKVTIPMSGKENEFLKELKAGVHYVIYVSITPGTAGNDDTGTATVETIDWE